MPVQGIIDEMRISNAVHPLPVWTSGEWVSDVFFPVRSYARDTELEFEHTLNGGDIFYDILDESDNPLVGHTHIVSSPHDISSVVGPIKVRVNLVRGTKMDVSPQVDSIRVTPFYWTYFPIIAHSVYGN